MAIDPGARIGAVHLTVADLGRLVSFYEARIGLTVRRRDSRTAWLGAGGPDLRFGIRRGTRYGSSRLTDRGGQGGGAGRYRVSVRRNCCPTFWNAARYVAASSSGAMVM